MWSSATAIGCRMRRCLTARCWPLFSAQRMRMEVSNKAQWPVVLGALVIFLLGFLAGALTINLYRPAMTVASRTAAYRGFEQVLDKLNLTPEQRAQVDEIIRDSRAQFIE